jgi:hypothetical protein
MAREAEHRKPVVGAAAAQIAVRKSQLRGASLRA